MSKPNNGWLGFDIGGANLKAASTSRKAIGRRFALWKSPEALPQELKSLASEFSPTLPLAFTMTGELADCFPSKREGVESIVELVESCFPRRLKAYYLTTGELVDADTAIVNWRYAAASNWHALASYVGTLHPEPTMLVDLGSTTCDIIPILDGKSASRGNTDPERMRSQELVYTGVDRSPVCAVLPNAEFRETQIQLAQEWFATMGDVYLLLGETSPQVDDCETADGRPKTLPCANQRLSRMLCADFEELEEADVISIARQAAESQRRSIVSSVQKVLGREERRISTIVLSGQGESLLRKWLSLDYSQDSLISFGSLLGEDVSRCAPAFAVAMLAAQATDSAREL